MLFLMRSKLQIVRAFNSMYKLMILSTYLFSNQSLPSFFSTIHKNSISHQMGVVDGRSYRVTRLVTCKKDVYLRSLALRAFI